MAIVLHPLVDLSTAWPPFFVEKLREIFTHGSGKSGSNFQGLRNQMVKSLPSAPPPGPATFIVKCLEALVHVGPPDGEGLSHLLISALCQSDRSKWPREDASIAQRLGGSLFCDALRGKIQMEPRIVVKLPGAFGFELKHIGDILILGKYDEGTRLEAAKEFVDQYILDLLKRRLYTGAVSLLKNFNLKSCDYQSLIAAIVDDNQASLAVDWASHLGKDMVAFLVQHCTEVGMYKVAYKVVKQYKLEADFPDAYYLYRQSSLRKLVDKGLWDVAQSIAEGDTQLIEYLVTLALDDNNSEKVADLCECFQLDQAQFFPEPESATNKGGSQYLQLESLIPEKNIHWIGTPEGLVFAERALFGIDVAGIDCEWKANTTKGLAPNKVSILQVASSDVVLVIDLISLLKGCQSSLNDFIKCLFHAPDILKLGYAVHNDLERLSRCFPEIEAFRVCEPVLDLQKVFGRQIKGGLSGLAKDVLGRRLNKQTRMSNWDIRPLSKKQLHYAALDALVLLHIFDSITNQPALFPNLQDWKAHMTSFRITSKHKSMLEVVDVEELGKLSTRGSLLSSHEDLDF